MLAAKTGAALWLKVSFGKQRENRSHGASGGCRPGGHTGGIFWGAVAPTLAPAARQYTAAILSLDRFMGRLIEEIGGLLNNTGRPQRDGLDRGRFEHAAFERDQARLQTFILGSEVAAQRGVLIPQGLDLPILFPA